jgi:Fe(3+) dicitrate transport protein
MKVAALAGACALLAASQVAFAQDGELTAPTVDVFGILPSDLEALPGSSTVLTEQEIEERRPFTVIEALREVPGLNVVPEDAAGTHLNIGMRGLNPRRSSRTLLMEDGAPTIFFAPYSDPSAHYSTPLEFVDRIEVLRGSGEILYGPQTMGGMINFVTRPVPSDGLAGSVTAEGGDRGYGGGHLNIGTGGERGGIMLDLLKKQGDGIRSNQDFDIQDATLKGQLNISPSQRLFAKGTFFEEDSLVSETGLTQEEYDENKYATPGDPQERYRMYRRMAQVVHELDLSDATTISTQFYYTNTWRESRRSREFEVDNDVAELEDDDFAARPRTYRTFGIEPKAQVRYDMFGVKNEATVGIRYHNEKVDRQKFELDGGLQGAPIFDERLTIDVDAMAYYAANTFYVGNWTFTPGLRFEDVKYDRVLYEGDPDAPADTLGSTQSTLLPGFGLTWNGLANTTLFAGIHKGFSPPRPDRDIDDGTIFDTQPEIAVTTEFGVRTRAIKGVNLEATAFHIDVSDMVVEVSGAFRNAGKAEHTGIDLGTRVDFGTIFNRPDNVFLSFAYTWLPVARFKNSGEIGGEGEDGYGNYEEGNRLPYAPKNLLSASLGYEHPSGVTARVGLNYISEQFANSENFSGGTDCPEGVTCEDDGLFGTVPAVTLFNASITYTPRNAPVTFYLYGENLADKEYFDSRTNGIQTGRPRQVVGGLTYRF